VVKKPRKVYKVKIIVDANIVFSAILNTNSKIADLFIVIVHGLKFAIYILHKENSIINKVGLRKHQVRGLRRPEIGSLLFVNDQFQVKHNEVIDVFLEPLFTLLPKPHYN